MKLTIDGGGQYYDWSSPHLPTRAGIAQGPGLNLVANPDLLCRPLPKVLCSFPGIQTGALLRWMEERGAEVSQYSGNAYFTREGELKDMIDLTEANLGQNRYIIGPIDPNYRGWLTERGIAHAILHPDRTMKSQWRALLSKQPGNTPGDISVFFKHWERSLKALEDVSEHELVQRYRIVIENNAMYVTGVPEYLKPETSAVKMHVASFHDEYEFLPDGTLKDGKEPIYSIAGEVYGRVKEHTIKLQDL